MNLKIPLLVSVMVLTIAFESTAAGRGNWRRKGRLFRRVKLMCDAFKDVDEIAPACTEIEGIEEGMEQIKVLMKENKKSIVEALTTACSLQTDSDSMDSGLKRKRQRICKWVNRKDKKQRQRKPRRG